jgi:hypothetical protein
MTTNKADELNPLCLALGWFFKAIRGRAYLNGWTLNTIRSTWRDARHN